MLEIRFDELNIVIGTKANGLELTAATSICDRFAGQSRIKIPVVNENEKHLFKKNLLVIGTPDSCAMLQKMKKPKYDGFLIEAYLTSYKNIDIISHYILYIMYKLKSVFSNYNRQKQINKTTKINKRL